MSRRRRELFPDESQTMMEGCCENDVGPLSLLYSDPESPLSLEIESSFNLKDSSAASDYVILETLQESPIETETALPTETIEAQPKSTPITLTDSASPLYLSPAQVVPKSPQTVPSPKKQQRTASDSKVDAESRARSSLFKPRSSSKLFLCARAKGRNRLGQINAGVGHKIKRPKPKPKQPEKEGISREQLEESDSALRALDASVVALKAAKTLKTTVDGVELLGEFRQ